MPPPLVCQRDRAEIDDRAAAGRAHHRRHRLDREELVPQVGRHAVRPSIRPSRPRSLCRWSLAALFTSTVIGPSSPAALGDGGLQRGDIPQVAVLIERRGMARAAATAPISAAAASSAISTNATFAPCAANCVTCSAPMPLRAAGDEHHAVPQARVDRETHRSWHTLLQLAARSSSTIASGAASIDDDRMFVGARFLQRGELAVEQRRRHEMALAAPPSARAISVVRACR